MTSPTFASLKVSPSPEMSSCSTRSRKFQLVQQPENNQSRAKWTASLTKTLVDLMVEEVHKGNKSNKSFTKKGWKFICDNFRDQTGLLWDNDQLKSRYVALRKQYIGIASLLHQPDFKWDEATGAIMATEEAWDKYIMDHPDAESIRSVGCPIYNQLQIIFAEAEISRKQNGSTNDIKGMACLEHLNVKVEELSPSESDKCADPTSRKRARRGIENAISNGILEMAAAAKHRAEAIKKFNGKFSITECVGALDELQGVNDQVYLAALDLFNNRNARETFLTIKVEKRLFWLLRKCASSALPES